MGSILIRTTHIINVCHEIKVPIYNLAANILINVIINILTYVIS